MPFVLAASAEMLFLELPFVERVQRLDALGFQVEIWDWATKDLRALAATGATFSSMTGYLQGNLTDEEAIDALLRSAEQSLRAADIIDSPRLNLHGTGLDKAGLPVSPRETTTGADWMRAADTLERLALLGERHGRVFTLENLNTTVDHPGTPFATAHDTLTLVEFVNHRSLRLNLDLYHAQIGEGNLIDLTTRALPYVGEIQVADVPGRFEPGTGEIRYEAIRDALVGHRYSGVVALEGWARGGSEEALRAFRSAFTVSSAERDAEDPLRAAPASTPRSPEGLIA
ncbi:TIM barrel protein [Agromyces albus]|uniref:TIM barrel protein n=1 Tax=Agromyces albus TaxID=205332 RepID=UPI002787FEC0|nr:TIM barrel protein [Agromyces albus]MDQ0575866.1 hydroxypyruvate isomerase [Agromyces albus]